MLSSEPPVEGCEAVAGCCAAVTTGVTGATGWKNDAWYMRFHFSKSYHCSTGGILTSAV